MASTASNKPARAGCALGYLSLFPPTLPFKRSTKNVSRELDNGEQIYACMYIDIY